MEKKDVIIFCCIMSYKLFKIGTVDLINAFLSSFSLSKYPL